jgi:hypothetical protein
MSWAKRSTRALEAARPCCQCGAETNNHYEATPPLASLVVFRFICSAKCLAEWDLLQAEAERKARYMTEI